MSSIDITLTPGRILGMRGYSELQFKPFGSIEGTDEIAELLVASVPAYTLKLTLLDTGESRKIGIKLLGKKYTLLPRLLIREGRKKYRVYGCQVEENVYTQLGKENGNKLPVTVEIDHVL